MRRCARMQVRPALPHDALAVARIHVRAWQTGYCGLIPDGYLDALRAEDRAARYTFGDPDPDKPATLVAVSDGEICGFVTTGPSPTAEAGEVLALHVDPDHWRRGVGRVLIAAGRASLFARGHRDAVLWVLAGNERAQQFYTSDGWELDGREQEQNVWGITVHELGYRRAL